MARLCVQIKLVLRHKAFCTKKTPQGFTYDWEVYIRGPEGIDFQNLVEKVVFHPHKDFPEIKRVVKEANSEGAYVLRESGSGSFLLPIEVYFRRREEPRKVKFDYELFLQNEGPPISYVRHKRLIFKNPSEEFRLKLIRGGGVEIVDQDCCSHKVPLQINRRKYGGKPGYYRVVDLPGSTEFVWSMAIFRQVYPDLKGSSEKNRYFAIQFNGERSFHQNLPLKYKCDRSMGLCGQTRHLWEPIKYLETGPDFSILDNEEASFQRHTFKMNHPIQLLDIIVSVYAYMDEVNFYWKHSGIEGPPACIFFDIDEIRNEITLILRLPKKPVSNVLEEGNPCNPIWSQHQSKEAVLACAKLILTLAFDVGMPIRNFSEAGKGEVKKWRHRIRVNTENRHLHGAPEGQLKNLLIQMLDPDPERRISLSEARNGLNDIQFSHPWIDTYYETKFYPLNRGLCIVMNNKNFSKANGFLEADREASQYDVEALQNTFGTILGFEVETHVDLTADQLRQLIKDLPKRNNLQDYGSVVFCIMSHGSEGVIYGVDWQPVKMEFELIYAVNDKTCRQLKGKPKVWITQACQNIPTETPLTWCERFLNFLSPPSIKHYKLEEPTNHSLWLSSTMTGYVSKRKVDEIPNPGSPYIQAFCKYLDSNTPAFPIKDVVEAHFKATAENVSDDGKDPFNLTLPGCETICPLDTFFQLIRNVTSDDLKVECKLTQPPPYYNPVLVIGMLSGLCVLLLLAFLAACAFWVRREKNGHAYTAIQAELI